MNGFVNRQPMITIRSRHPRLGTLLLVIVGLRGAALGDDNSAVTDLRATSARMDGNWLVYSVEDVDGDDVVHVRDLSTGETTNTGLVAKVGLVSGNWAVLYDRYVHVHDLATGETRSTGRGWGHAYIIGNWLVIGGYVYNLLTSEVSHPGVNALGVNTVEGTLSRGSGDSIFLGVPEDTEDLNGDGDTSDVVAMVYNLSERLMSSTGLALGSQDWGCAFPHAAFELEWPTLLGDWLLFFVSERQQHEDLNFDGDVTDRGIAHLFERVTGDVTNLGGSSAQISDDWLVYSVDERFARDDLNGDGDLEDEVLHKHQLATGEITNIRMAGYVLRILGETMLFTDRAHTHVHNLRTGVTTTPQRSSPCGGPLTGDWLVSVVLEERDGDLNGDGDTADLVAQVYYLSTGLTLNTGLAMAEGSEGWSQPVVSGKWLSLLVGEHEHAADLNGDGEIGPGQSGVAHVFDLPTGRVTNFRVSGENVCDGCRFDHHIIGEWLLLGESGEMHIHNLRRAETRTIDFGGNVTISGLWMLVGRHPEYFLIDLFLLFEAGRFRRGDPNSSGTTDISDAITVLGYLFVGSPKALLCLESADTNNDGAIDISDGIAILQFLFLGGPPPAPPGPCGVDPDPAGSEGDLGCERYEPCF